MARTTSSFRRKEPRFVQQAQILVVCEDSKSSKTYLEDAAQYYRANAKINVAHIGNTDPKAIVTHAIKEKNKYEEVYCVIDRDRHENWDVAIEKAASNGVNIIDSHPCYEFWLLLHFGYTRRGFQEERGKSPAEVVAAELRQNQIMRNYQKGSTESIFHKLLELIETAIRNAERVLADVDAVNELNPSTKIHQLIKKFRDLSEPINT